MSSRPLRSRALRTAFLLPATVAAAAACSDAPPPASGEHVGAQAAAITATTEWLDGMELGGGVDLVAADARGKCVTSAGLAAAVPGYDGGFTMWGITYVENAEELEKELGVAVGARAKGAGYSASSKIEYAKKVKSSSYKVYAVVRVRVLQAMQILQNPRLASATAGDELGAAELAANGKKDELRRMCGDAYVAGVQGGGELLGLFEIETKGRDEFEQVKASVKANAGVYSGSAEFQSKFEVITRSYSFNFSGYKLGGKETLARSDDPKAFIDHALRFEEDVAAKPAVVRALLKDYDTLPNFRGPSPAKVGRQLRALDELDRQRLEVQTRMADIDYVLTHANQFEAGYDPSLLTKGADQLRRVLNQLESSIVDCTEDLNQCAFPEDLSLPSVTLPPWTAHVGPLGADAGADASDAGSSPPPAPPPPAPIYGPAEICGVLRYNAKAAPPCRFVPGAPIMGTDANVCGVDDVKQTIQDARCGMKQAKTCRDMRCPGSTPAVPPRRRPGEPAHLCESTPGPDDPFDPRCGRPAYPAMCTDASICGVAAWNTCDIVVGQTPRTCPIGKQPDGYETCEDASFGVSEYKPCWHNVDGTAYTGPTPQ